VRGEGEKGRKGERRKRKENVGSTFSESKKVNSISPSHFWARLKLRQLSIIVSVTRAFCFVSSPFEVQKKCEAEEKVLLRNSQSTLKVDEAALVQRSDRSDSSLNAEERVEAIRAPRSRHEKAKSTKFWFRKIVEMVRMQGIDENDNRVPTTIYGYEIRQKNTTSKTARDWNQNQPTEKTTNRLLPYSLHIPPSLFLLSESRPWLK